jgi:branched-chain amino acid transport system ATP-binding protein
MNLLSVNGLTAGYGKAEVLHGVTLSVAERQIVAIVGPNGAGKSTLMHAVMGLQPRTGQISCMGQDAGDVGWMVQRGVVLVPETRALFTDMSVEDNLLLGGFARWRQGARDGKSLMADVFEIFPRLAERRRQSAGTLSGGERQMLALGRALMSEPRLLMLDEPSLGLAPAVVEQLYDTLGELHRQGLTLLLAEQSIPLALGMADYAYVLQTGRIALEGPTAELERNEQVKEIYLGVSTRAALQP